MLLAIDVGNSNIVLGVFDGAALVQSWRLQTLRERTSDELGLLVDGLFAHSRIERVQIRGVVLGSVVPPLTGTIRAMTERYFGVPAMTVEPGVNTGMPILYENPWEVGADRIVNSIAAFRRFGGSCIVVDFGTATNFDCVSESGEYLGGAIAPGIEVAVEALTSRAARLLKVEFVEPAAAIGKSTVAALQSGIIYGTVAMVDGLVARLKAELGAGSLVVATGGLAELIVPLSVEIDEHAPTLTLEGLRLVYEQNAARAPR